jgi:hypothetical protein
MYSLLQQLNHCTFFFRFGNDQNFVGVTRQKHIGDTEQGALIARCSSTVQRSTDGIRTYTQFIGDLDLGDVIM